MGIHLQLGAQMRSLRVEAAKCSAGFSRHSAPPAASGFALRAELSLLKAGLRGVARSFRKTLPFGSSEGWPETWTFFRARSRRYMRASFLRHGVCSGIWVQACQLQPRTLTWWQSFARLKSSARIFSDVTHTFANIRVRAL